MFTAFHTTADVAHPRRLALAGLVAAAALAALAVVSLALTAPRAQQGRPELSVDVSFRPPPPPPAPAVIDNPPPPPPPKVARAPKPPAPAVEAPPPVAAPPAAAAMVAPTDLPTKAAPEVDKAQAVAAINVAVGGSGDGRGTAVGGPSRSGDDESPAPAVANALGGPITLPEDAEPPEPSEDNALPEYPEAARNTGVEAVVILKVVIEANGTVGRVQVLKGEEPFLTAALSVVKRWVYEPAKLDGKPIAIFKIIKIPFRLKS